MPMILFTTVGGGEPTPACPKCGRMMTRRHLDNIYDSRRWECRSCD